MAHDVMTAEQAAEFLQTSRDTLLRKARRGELPAAKVGREWRFSRTELDEWVMAGGDRPAALFDERLGRDNARRQASPSSQAAPPPKGIAKARCRR